MGNVVCYESNKDDVVEAVDVDRSASAEGEGSQGERAKPAKKQKLLVVDKVHNHETCTEDHEHSILTQDNDGDGVADVLQDDTLWTEESAKALFTLYDKDSNGHIDQAEMQQLIVKCLTLFVPAEQADLRDEVIAEFTRGSREYCMLALSIVSVDEDGDGVADNVTFGTFFKWLKSDDNFLLFPIQKTRVMLWLFDLFQKFDGDHSGSVSEQEYTTAMAHLKEEISNVHPEQATKILEELKFQDYDWDDEDAALSVKEMVHKVLESWERLHIALF